MASRRVSDLISPAGLTTESRSVTVIRGNRIQLITRSSSSLFILHQATTPLKISTSGAKNESRCNNSTRDD